MRTAGFIIFLFLSTCCWGQKTNVAAAGKRMTLDTTHMSLLLDSAKKLRYQDTAQHTAITNKVLVLAKAASDKRWMAKALYEKAVLSTTVTAIDFLTEAATLAKEIKDTLLQVSINSLLGFRYSTNNQRTRALDVLFNSLKLLAKKPSPRDLEVTYGSIGSIYVGLDDKRCLEYLEKSLELRSRDIGKDSFRISNHLVNLAYAHFHFGDIRKAIDYSERCARIRINGELRWQSYSAISNLAGYYVELTDKQLEQAKLSLEEALARSQHYSERLIADAKTNAHAKAQIHAAYLHLGRVYLKKRQFQQAYNHLKTAEQLLSNHSSGVRETIHDYLSQAFAGLGKYDSAYLYKTHYTKWKDSSVQYEIIKEAERKRVEYEFSKIQDSLEQIQLFTAEKLKHQQLLAIQQSQALQLKQALLDLNIQERQIADLAYQKASAELLANQGLIKEKEKQLTITRQEKALQESKVTLQQQQLQLARQELQTKKQQQVFLLAGAALLLLSLLLAFRIYSNRQKAKAIISGERLKAQKAEAIRKMAEFEMHGLRAQLNPHFMFNSLNAIQEQILREDTESAGFYLTTFSKMLRQLLENAEHSFVPLRKELDFLKLYLNMEQLRIPDLQYDLQIDPAIDADSFMIPNMILQPYLENAIWHGLSPKPGQKHIWIDIAAVNSGISIELVDNGIGRKKAAELKSRYRKAHQSKGMELLRKRFELIKVEFGSSIQIDIEDLADGATAMGTKVSLYIPHTFSKPMENMYELVGSN